MYDVNFMMEESEEFQTTSSSIRPPPKRAQPPRKSKHEKEEKSQNDPKIQKIARNIISEANYEGVNKENSPMVASELQKFQNSLQNKSMYMKAEEVEKCIQKVKSYQASNKYVQLQTQRAANYSEILDNTKNENNDLKNQWEEIIKNAEEKRDNEIAELQESFITELEIFDQQFNEPIPNKFVKFSAKYIDLRQRQKIMASSDHFMEAKQIKKIADELEKQERLQQEGNWIQYLNQNRKSIIREQEKKLETKISAWDKIISQMKNQSKSEIMHGKRSEDYLENKINSAVSDLDVEIDVEYEKNKMKTGKNTQNPSQKSQLNETSVSMAGKNSVPNRIIRPLSEKELKFKQRKKANFITYTKTFLPRNSRK